VRLLAIALASATLAGDAEPSDFRWVRVVHEGGAAPVRIEPDGGLFEHARLGFQDLRVVDAGGDQVPWRMLPPPTPGAHEHVVPLNSGRQGPFAVALLDLGRPRSVRDRLELDIPDQEFVGSVVVFGADRRNGPFTRLSETGIYAVSGAQPARSTAAVFPPTDFRYLRVRARGVSQIEGAAVSGTQDRLRSVRRPHELAVHTTGTRTTVTLDFGYKNMPVDDLLLTAATPRYDRPAVVDASNNGRVWRNVTYARLSRYEGSPPAPLSVGVRARFVRIRIDNGDDPPLAGIRVAASSRSHALVLEAGHRPPYRLLYGNPMVRAPEYEFTRLPFDSEQHLIDGTFGEERRNPAFTAPTRPFGERHGWILSAALVAAAAAVGLAGFLAIRRRA
jgi:hypothetical protein